MDELARKRAEKTNDSTQWSVLDALEDTVERIKRGELNPECVVCHMWEQGEKAGVKRHTFVAAQITYEQHIALLNVALRRALNDWMG